MSSKKQTAVEWLKDKIKDLILNDVDSQLKFKNILRHAKAGEKQQIKDAFLQGDSEWQQTDESADEYYNQTYL